MASHKGKQSQLIGRKEAELLAVSTALQALLAELQSIDDSMSLYLHHYTDCPASANSTKPRGPCDCRPGHLLDRWRTLARGREI